MTDRLPADAPAPTRATRRRRVLRYLGFATAIGLLAGSIYFAAKDGDFSALRECQRLGRAYKGPDAGPDPRGASAA